MRKVLARGPGVYENVRRLSRITDHKTPFNDIKYRLRPTRVWTDKDREKGLYVCTGYWHRDPAKDTFINVNFYS